MASTESIVRGVGDENVTVAIDGDRVGSAKLLLSPGNPSRLYPNSLFPASV